MTMPGKRRPGTRRTHGVHGVSQKVHLHSLHWFFLDALRRACGAEDGAERRATRWGEGCAAGKRVLRLPSLS